MALPALIQNTYKIRKKRIIRAFEAGAIVTGTHQPPRSAKCDFCNRPEGHGLYELRCPDGTTYMVGPECRDAYLGLDATNIVQLKRLV